MECTKIDFKLELLDLPEQNGGVLRFPRADVGGHLSIHETDDRPEFSEGTDTYVVVRVYDGFARKQSVFLVKDSEEAFLHQLLDWRASFMQEELFKASDKTWKDAITYVRRLPWYSRLLNIF